MENIHTYHSDLITKYLSGEINKKEFRDLKEWLQSDPKHQKLYDEYRKTWVLIENSKIDSTEVVEEEWSKLKIKIDGSQKSAVRSRQSVVGSRFVKSTGRKTDFMLLPFFNDTPKISGFGWVIRIAAVFLLIAIPGFLLFRYFNNPAIKVITAQNEVADVNLPDGTLVSLYRGSTIEYPEHFKGDIREIKLTGEAFFSVKHDDKSKFIIVYDNVRIEDIGTAFYVNTNKSLGQMEVVLTEGKVTVFFEDNPSGQVYILPGEKVEVGLTGNTIKKSINDDGNYLSWKTKKLVFSNNSMSEVVALLKKVYHSDIRITGKNLNNCRLTATFDNQSLESIFNVIKSTLGVSIIFNGSAFEISGNRCDL